MINSIIVDDEAPSRSELRFLLDEVGGVVVAAEAANACEAIEKLRECPCDVIFLDVNMPGATGLQFAAELRRLSSPPAVVFVTAYREHALEAFNVNAIDYLIKPVEAERLVQAIERVYKRMAQHTQARKPSKIPAKKGSKKLFIDIDRIRYATAHNGNVYLHTDTGQYLSLAANLSQLEKRLENYSFFRVNKSFLINLSMVEEIESASNGTLLLKLNDIEEKISVSRRRKAAFQNTLYTQASRTRFKAYR